MLHWLFVKPGEAIVAENPVEGIQLVDGKPVSEKPDTFFRSVRRFFESPNAEKSPKDHFSRTLVKSEYPGATSKHVLRSALSFGVRCEQVVVTDDVSRNVMKPEEPKDGEKKSSLPEFKHSLNFGIRAPASAVEDGAGVLIGFAPRDMNPNTPMLYDEPGGAFLNCTATEGARLWSSSLGFFGSKISDRCLEKSSNSSSSSGGGGGGDEYVGAVRLEWTEEPAKQVRFSVIDPKRMREAETSSEMQLVGSKMIQYDPAKAAKPDTPGEDFDCEALVPMVGFSADVTPNQCVFLF